MPDSRHDRPVVFLNFWSEGGMKHYADSIVHALLAGARVCYVRNYEGSTGADGPVLDLRFPPVRVRDWSALLRIARLLFSAKPLAVHLNNEQPALLPLYPVFAFFNSVITLHDAVPHAGESFAKRCFFRMHTVLVWLCFRKIIVHSEAIRAALPALLRRKRIYILPHVNYQQWARNPAPEPPAEPFTLLFFGRILAYKGLDDLLAAFRTLDPQRFRLVIAGAGEVPLLTASNIELRNHFIGDAEMADVFSRAHAVVLPYVAASQSGVAYMALAFGRPIVATRVGALPDVVEDGVNGFLVAPHDPPALAAAIERLTDRALCRQLVENIRAQNISSDDATRAGLLAIYRE